MVIEQMASTAQINYARALLKELGYDEDEYDLERMSRSRISALIGELKDELEG